MGHRSAHSTLSRQRGVTLIELIVVMVIIGVLIGIAAVSYQNMRQRYAIEKQVKEMYTDLMNARLRAVQHDRMQFVVFPTLTGYSVYEDGPPPDGNEGFDGTGTDLLVSSTSLLPSYSAIMSDPSLTLVKFTTKGLLSASTPTGSIRISPTAGGEYDCVFLDKIITGMGQWNGSECVVK
jgi:prepilin-type N-terminal cleavage/methylation domain-containing protein